MGFVALALTLSFAAIDARAQSPAADLPVVPDPNPAESPAPSAEIRPALSPPAARRNQFHVYIASEQYVWKEFLDNGSQLLKEKGTLFGIGFSFYHEFRNHLTIKLGIEIFGGSTDYDGRTQSGTPATTTVGYTGFKLGVDGGYRFRPSESVFL